MVTDPLRPAGRVPRPPRPTARGARLLPATLLLATAGCTVADNLSFEEIITELDNVAATHPDRADGKVTYAERAEVSTWYVRQWWLWPFRWALGPVFGWRSMQKLENPAEHVRQLLIELPDETGGDLLPCALATVRMAWLAELASNGSSRIAALDGLAAMAAQLGLALFQDPATLDGVGPDDAHLLAARAAAQVGRPELRADSTWDDTRLQAYADAVTGLTDRPLADWMQRIALVEQLIQLRRQEHDGRAIPAVEAALRRAIGYCVEGALVREVKSRDPQRVEVRLCAMQQLRRFGGAPAVPLLLALMAASPAELARGEARYDPDPLIQLRLIHYCGQLGADQASRSVRLPGRSDWEVLAPVDFLAQTILNEQAYFSPLRVPATIALSLALGRDRIEHDQAWVRTWWLARQGQS